jgi:subtilisin family serine protease
MKYTKLVLSFGVILALASCKTTQKTTKTTVEIPAIVTSTEGIVAKKGKMTKEEIRNWPHMDIFTDSVPGISLDKAYDFVKNKTPKTVIVGIIDSGVDIEHEDLKNKIWTNPKEIAGNGIDDDKNGYVDDIHGWNFLGGEKGSAAPEQLEVTRLVKQLSPKYEGKTEDQIAEADKVEYKEYLKMKAKVDDEINKAKAQLVFYEGLYNNLKKADDFLTEKLGKDNYTLDEVQKFADNEAVKPALMYLPRILGQGGKIKEAVEQIKGGVDYFASKVNYMYNLDFKGRVTGDNPDDWNDKHGYGNNIVLGAGPDELHGTHVAGIVGAERNNGIGMNGVAAPVVFITARAVPDGDEYDKDVAKAIRYVVDNGAKVVNMSFGKGYSPHSDWVYDAMKYAAEHDVLLVKAAGNDAKNIDLAENLHFPTDSPDAPENEITDNVVTVGAMTRHFNDKLVASFSNYGKNRVDIFAPGLEIYSTVPKDNQYKSIQGTSMASPEVAGVAALIRAYYPNLTAKQVKQILIDSGIKYKGEVIKPGTKDEKIPFESMSKKGRILNAYNALLLAEKMSRESN